MVESYNCEEDFSLIDQRLAISTVACLFSLFALIYDYIFPFPQSKSILLICSVRYPLLVHQGLCNTHKHSSIHNRCILHNNMHTHTHTQTQNCLLNFNNATYFILMGVLSMFMMYKEKNTFYVGLEKDPAGVVCSAHPTVHVCFMFL